MNLGVQKELAARTLKASKDRIKFKPKTEEDLERIKNILTREDVRELFKEGLIVKLPKRGNSRTRANYIKNQKKKGRRRGYGSRKGTKKARFNTKKLWMIKIRALRKYLKELKSNGSISVKNYRILYKKTKTNYFRGKKHLRLYLLQNELLEKSNEVKK